MYSSAHVHYLNKYPGGTVDSSEDSLDVRCAMGKPRVSLRKNGAGQWIDVSEKMGCLDRHCLAPIPRDSRVFKLAREGHVENDDQAQARVGIREELAASTVGGPDRVPSIAELVRSQNPAADLRNIDSKFEYGKWEQRPRNTRAAASQAAYQPGLQNIPAATPPSPPSFQ